MEILLASKSPRRKELLQLLQMDFQVVCKDVKEELDRLNDLEEEIQKLAIKKAQAVACEHPNCLVIGADTIVVLNQQVLGKPKDEQEAFTMLKALSGQTHEVLTAVALIYKGKIESFCSKTEVSFESLSDQEILDYIQSKEPMDKAGAYGIQGYGSKFISHISGDYYAVMGLPVSALYQRLKQYR
ncbi:MAG: Maf family protein [Erysipelotrichaceae bacterium]|nr:Maf family protein [Erysipelotrichaceae bacterium]